MNVSPEFEDWRAKARESLMLGYRPDEIDFVDSTAITAGDLGFAVDASPNGLPVAKPHVPKEFPGRAEVVATHRDPQRWNLLYRLLWRLQLEADLLRVEVDDDVAQFGRLEHQVRRDLHKMHAFVRFRGIETEGEEHFVAWYQPDHRIVGLAAPFFAERFAVMRWSILTPDASVNWSPQSRQLAFGPGVPREDAPQADALEALWKTYYGSVFNPARLNTKAMRNEMPIRYWKNLPEIESLPHLIQKAEERVERMVIVQKSKPSAEPFVPELHTLAVLRESMPSCMGCELYEHATQVVPGQGGERARLMLVGEQPGDQEDRQGLPFVGPAGALLRKAMAELGIDEKELFVTNAVKHFKFVQRGKIRLHQNPRMSEISACRPWLQAEIDAVKPKVILCLGASAAKSLLGGTFALMAQRGKRQESPYAEQMYATVHPSAVLRARDDAGRQALYEFLKDDLAVAWHAAMVAE